MRLRPRSERWMRLTQGSGTRIARRGATKKVSFGESSDNGSGGILTVRVYKHYASLGVERSAPCGIPAWPRHVGLQQGLKYRVMIDSKNSIWRRAYSHRSDGHLVYGQRFRSEWTPGSSTMSVQVQSGRSAGSAHLRISARVVNGALRQGAHPSHKYVIS
jgi:hypothetical protein